jgi:hypothetical protein
MKKFLYGMVAILVICVTASPADAGWHEFWRGFKRDFHRSNAYPEPFRYADREAQKAPFRAMIENGWRTENTLTESLFTPENSLTRAGEKKVHWIVTQSPENRRSVYVISANSRQVTEARLDSVQRYITRVVPEGALPRVVVTTRIPRGGSGDFLNEMHKKYRDSLPAPQLPSVSESN